MPNVPKISIIIIAYNEEENIARCLASVFSESRRYKEDVEIIVVDNSSTDRTKKIIQEFPVQYFFEKEKGASYARNTGWRYAQGDVIVFLDGDCTVPQGWLADIIKAFDDPFIDAYGCNVLHISSNKIIATLSNLCTQYLVNLSRAQYTFFGTLNGAAMAIRKRALEEIGGFSPIQNGEDTEISLQLVYKNYQIFFSQDIAVSHHTLQSLMPLLLSLPRKSADAFRLRLAWKDALQPYGYNPKRSISIVPLIFPKLKSPFLSFKDYGNFFAIFLLTIFGFFLKVFNNGYFMFFYRPHTKQRPITSRELQFKFDKKIIRLKEGVKFKLFNGEIIFCLPYNKIPFIIDNVGCEFWKLLVKNAPDSEILNTLTNQYSVDEKTLLLDLNDLLKTLSEKGMIEIENLP